MSLELNCRCDECKKALYENDEIVCYSCFEMLKNEIEKLKDKIEELESKINE